MSRDKPPYEVGYRKPPIATQFAKGRSGNPKGRPKGSKSVDRLLEEELARTIVVTENGKRRTITKGQAVAKQAVNKAISGDFKLISLILTASRSIEANAQAGGAQPLNSDKDLEVLLDFLNRTGGHGMRSTGETGEV